MLKEGGWFIADYVGTYKYSHFTSFIYSLYYGYMPKLRENIAYIRTQLRCMLAL